MNITLREVTGQTVRQICRLSDSLPAGQRRMVAPNAVSIAEAYFEPRFWFRAIYAGEEPIGFLMLLDDPAVPRYFLWRFMIARPFQGQGFGRQAMQLLIDHVRSRPGATVLGVSCGEGENNPEGFYRKLGFCRTGEMLGDEVELALPLDGPPCEGL